MSIKERLAKIKPKPVQVKIENLHGEKVYVLPETVDEQREADKLEDQALDEEVSIDSVYSAVVLERLVEEDGTPVFDVDEDADDLGLSDEDMEIWNGIPADAIKEIYRCIRHEAVRRQAKVSDAKGN